MMRTVIDDARRGRGSRVPTFTLSFLVGIVVGVLGTFAALNGRLVAVEVQVRQLAETTKAIGAEQRDEQGKQAAALEDLTVQLAQLTSRDDVRAGKRP